jgi:Na+-translocating ferredoxin:NAD+ oxidoreductase subunit D
MIAAPAGPEKFDIAKVMRQVLLAMLPGVTVAIAFFGFGVLFNVALAVLFALLCETLALYLRNQPVLFQLRDNSVLITATLLGLALPPYAPWWVILCGSASAILFGKQAYGGLGQNVFNPAMLGYLTMLLLFPAQLAHWPVIAAQAAPAFDGYTMATALDTFKQNNSLTVADWWQQHTA